MKLKVKAVPATADTHSFSSVKATEQLFMNGADLFISNYSSILLLYIVCKLMFLTQLHELEIINVNSLERFSGLLFLVWLAENR